MARSFVLSWYNDIMIGQFVKGRAYVFIDAANILYSQQTLGWRIDYKRLYEYCADETKLVGVRYYTGKVGTLEKQLKFIRKLETLRYTVVAKEVKFIKIDGGKLLPKGNLDVELALDAMRLASKYDSLVLFSGDSDFAYLIDLLKESGKQVIVLSTRGHVSKELLDRAKYVDLQKLKDRISLESLKNQEPPESDS